ncbi:serine/threonine-protein kinase [Tuwongella immobilis]|uniref:Protein kinase domain-containing protein n=1 Tax=Tuwongella immobilis TaxID=692036 RepID=A0A6C2YR53_9BACT|nr:serine/threonine-protein kinase [Tuwongella immobilis]VIP04128.1 serine threonine protein kinase : Serine/threonine protein kinase with PASTA sensor(S) OS=Caldalkalibacillus thermarum TA2.A1 GN=CathTA2_1894 PE=4 SV=1: Pkinase [Tuwongella immobilis]VTS05621.1 serine threonine protein kinase : Serine/threonine protein kinase with PASTA sensor(S) OS=Caldalkalibacillus thermarum TA2.A1 GN=CathTA2_1894 PE=4 SV=1: Pkinase [Tuwongella immobilis]
MNFLPPMRLTPSESNRLGAYHLLRVLDEGGMSTVYLAFDELNNRNVALKVLSDRYANDPFNVERFQREWKLTERLNHPNLVRGLDFGHDSATNRYYLVLEYIDGPCVQRRLDQDGHIPLGESLAIVRDIASALADLHRRNLVHRDIKPGNILIDPQGCAKLIDFGLAKKLQSNSSLTQGSETCGTPYYMSYEQGIAPADVRQPSDLFSLGATFYHMVTGEVPFPGREPREIARKKLAGTYIPASERLLGLLPHQARAIDSLIAQLLARNPAERFQSADQLIESIDHSGLPVGMPELQSRADFDLLGTAEIPAADAEPIVDLAATRPDLPNQSVVAPTNEPVSAMANAVYDAIWAVRMIHPNGEDSLIQATGRELRDWASLGYISPQVMVARTEHSHFRPIVTYPEFAQLEFSEPLLPKSHTCDPPAPIPNCVRRIWWSIPISLALGMLVAAGLMHWYVTSGIPCGTCWLTCEPKPVLDSGIPNPVPTPEPIEAEPDAPGDMHIGMPATEPILSSNRRILLQDSLARGVHHPHFAP